MPLTAQKKIYITKSAYVLEAYNNLAGANSVRAKLTVVGVLQSSAVTYTIRLLRGSKVISSYDRTGLAYADSSISVNFTGVINTGSISVEFRLKKSGSGGLGTPGSAYAQLYVR